MWSDSNEKLFTKSNTSLRVHHSWKDFIVPFVNYKGGGLQVVRWFGASNKLGCGKLYNSFLETPVWYSNLVAWFRNWIFVIMNLVFWIQCKEHIWKRSRIKRFTLEDNASKVFTLLMDVRHRKIGNYNIFCEDNIQWQRSTWGGIFSYSVYVYFTWCPVTWGWP